MSQSRIAGRTALVTGANRGIGLAVTKNLLDRGAAKVYATARDPETLTSLVQEYGDRVVALPLDVTNAKQVEAAAAKAKDVDLLVNNAGIAQHGVPAFGHADWIATGERELGVNLFGTYRVTEAFAPVLAANGGGTVANVISIAGFANFPLFSSYSTSKAALHSLTQAMRVLLATNKTRVIGVYPGPVDTDMADGIPFEKASPESVAAEIVSGIERGDEEILPDVMAREMGGLYQSDPKALEGQIAAMSGDAIAN